MRFLFIALLFLAGQADAQEPCAPRQQVLNGLKAQYGETRHGMGFQPKDGVVYETFANDETGTWTIIQSRPDGQSCIMASGELWETAAPEKPGKDA